MICYKLCKNASIYFFAELIRTALISAGKYIVIFSQLKIKTSKKKKKKKKQVTLTLILLFYLYMKTW